MKLKNILGYSSSEFKFKNMQGFQRFYMNAASMDIQLKCIYITTIDIRMA